MTKIKESKVVLFDSECMFCNASVNLIMDNDSPFQFQFTSLTGPTGKELLQDYKVPPIDSVILLDRETKQWYAYSTAILMILAALDPWYLRWFSIFLYVPALIRDPFYHAFAYCRYGVSKFIPKSVCRLPVKGRFLK